MHIETLGWPDNWMFEIFKSLMGLCMLGSQDCAYQCQGTGTAAGDSIEFSAIQSVYGSSRHQGPPLVVGSIKSNIGHLESCSALASVVKVVECLERGQIPPQMHFRHPNPKIDFDNTIIPTNVVAWPSEEGTIRRAAVNTFGAGGTNGHAILESYPTNPVTSAVSTRRSYLLKVSASEDTSLQALSLAYAQYIEERRPCLQGLAYTLLSRRSLLRKSILFASSSIEEVIHGLRSNTGKVHTKTMDCSGETVFVFTGQGAQW